MFNGKTHYKWPFSIAMFVYQRVPPNSILETKTGRHGRGVLTKAKE